MRIVFKVSRDLVQVKHHSCTSSYLIKLFSNFDNNNNQVLDLVEVADMIYPIVTAGALVAKISEQRKGEGSVSLEIA